MAWDTHELSRSRARTHRLFNRAAPAFRIIDRFLLPEYRRALERLALPGELSVLDLGTGTGTLALAFAERGHAVTGIDFAGRLLRRARRRVPAASFLDGDLADLAGLPAASHDVVSFAHVLHGLDPELRRFAVAEAGRIARRWIVVIDYAGRGPWYVRLVEWLEGPHYGEFVRTPVGSALAGVGLEVVAAVLSNPWSGCWLCRARSQESGGE